MDASDHRQPIERCARKRRNDRNICDIQSSHPHNSCDRAPDGEDHESRLSPATMCKVCGGRPYSTGSSPKHVSIERECHQTTRSEVTVTTSAPCPTVERVGACPFKRRAPRNRAS